MNQKEGTKEIKKVHFTISPSELEKLDRIADEKEMTRATFIRSLIIENNRNYTNET